MSVTNGLPNDRKTRLKGNNFVIDHANNPSGFIIPNEYYRTNVLSRYLNKEFTLTLPPGKTVTDLQWFSVYDIETGSNFGEVIFPQDFQPPQKQHLQALEGISNNVR